MERKIEMRHSIQFSNTNILTHQFFAIVDTKTGWTVCVAGRHGLGTRYTTPISLRFPTKQLAKEWRGRHLAKKPADYWIAEEGKYLIRESGELVPCWRTEKAIREGRLTPLTL